MTNPPGIGRLHRKLSPRGKERTIPKRIDLKKIAGIVIGGGPHREQYTEASPTELCVMEAVSFLIGGSDYLRNFNYNPPCVSEAIAEFLMEVNDLWSSDRKRKRLALAVAPKIVGTAPTKRDGDTVTPKLGVKAHEHREDKRYKLVERFLQTLPQNSYGGGDLKKATVPQVVAVVDELVNVK